MASILARNIHGRTYYYYQRSWRAKEGSGKTRGTGRSKVMTEQIYLGSAEDVLQKIQANQSPEEVQHLTFGLEAAAVQVVRELNLVEAIDRCVPKRAQGLSIGQYLVVAAINRIARPTSRAGIADWCNHSVIPRLMDLPKGLLSSQNFWDAFDKVRAPHQEEADLSEDTVLSIQHEIWMSLLQRYNLHLDTFLYDTTNLFTFLDRQTDSELVRYAHSKDGKAGKRCLGLALMQNLHGDFPMFHLAYAGNMADARLFPTVLQKLTDSYSALCRSAQGATLVFDKGNNSEANIRQTVTGHRMRIIGSLAPNHVQDLMRKNQRSYNLRIAGFPAFSVLREVFGFPGRVVVTFNGKLCRRQHIRFDENLDKTEKMLKEELGKIRSGSSKSKMEERIRKILGKSRYGRFFTVAIRGRRFKGIDLKRNKALIQARRQRFGKTVIFTTDASMKPEEVVGLYRKRGKIEQTFRLGKDPAGIPFRPVHAWTDSKIRVFSFICVLALLIWRVMQWKLKLVGMPMSDKVLKKELADIREVVLVWGPKKVENRLSTCSSVQAELITALGIGHLAPSG